MPKTVSATSFDVDGEVRFMDRPQVPNYALRRLVVGTAAVVALTFGLLASVGVLAGIAGIVGGGTASAASAAPSQAVVQPTVHIAQPGDTMWSIASTYRGDVDHGRYVDALIDINGGAGVQAGSAVLLP